VKGNNGGVRNATCGRHRRKTSFELFVTAFWLSFMIKRSSGHHENCSSAALPLLLAAAAPLLASHGHLSCLQILLQNGARASKEGFEVAMQNGHNSCATLLQKADASCATLVAKVDASCETRDVPAVVQKQSTPMLADVSLQWAYSHDFPAEDLSQCGAENGWPPGFFGPKKSSALIAAGVTTFTQLIEVVGSRSMEQFCAEYGSCFAGAHGRDARAMWLLVSAWESEKKSRV